MPRNLIAAMNPARLSSYEAEWSREMTDASKSATTSSVTALYVWQVALSSAWYETLSYVEAVVRNAVDGALRTWNLGQGRSEDWLDDAAVPLKSLISKAADNAQYRAEQAMKRRHPDHPRHNAPVSFDDRISQLDFGNIVHLFPLSPPAKRSQRGTGLSGRENLWLHGIAPAFPELGTQAVNHWEGLYPARVPEDVKAGYAVGHAIDRLRRLRNRISHHEQTFHVNHEGRLSDATMVLSGISPHIAGDLDRLDRVRRALALRPRP